MNRTPNQTHFLDLYLSALTNAVTTHPDEYLYPVESVPGVVTRMAAAIDRNSYNKDGYALKAVCKALNIPYTYKGINVYWWDKS